jgi:hypothetical protein
MTEPDVDTINAVVHGQAMVQNDTPVEGAKVTLTHYPKGCEKDSFSREVDFEYTGESGAYSLVYHVGEIRPNSCFLADLEPPEGKFAAPDPREFRADFREDPPYDSVRVDFALKLMNQ